MPGPGQRQHDPPVVWNGPAPSMQAASSISRGSCMKNCRIRNVPNALNMPGRNRRRNGVEQVAALHDLVLRNQEQLGRNHQHRQEQREHDVLAPESQPGERISGERAEEHLTGRAGNGHEHRVDEHLAERHGAEHVGDSSTIAELAERRSAEPPSPRRTSRPRSGSPAGTARSSAAPRPRGSGARRGGRTAPAFEGVVELRSPRRRYS